MGPLGPSPCDDERPRKKAVRRTAGRIRQGGPGVTQGPALALLAGAEPKRGPALALQPQTDGPACQWMLLSESPAVASDFV